MMRTLEVRRRSWRLTEPFVISRGQRSVADVILVQLGAGGHVGRGEAAGVRYHGETQDSMQAQIESVADALRGGADRADLLQLLPAGGARNAVDAALWDLEAKTTGKPAWQLAKVAATHPLVTNFTIGIRSLRSYEDRARDLAHYPWLKVKVGTEQPLEAVAAVRRGAPHARLVVDANQAWTPQLLMQLAPQLADLKVDLLEQPIAGEVDAILDKLDLPVPICADEPVNTVADLPRIADRYDFVNIKLDKAGGLTAALELAYAAQKQGLRLMVGCMVASSMSMAPAMIVGQYCEVIDLDGPLLQAEDWPHGIQYSAGTMSEPWPLLWG
jgi:L-Ala-D/L-Glu epimerase